MSEYSPLGVYDVMPFGKYRNETIGHLINTDLQYLEWVVKNTSLQIYQEVIDIIDHKAENPDFKVEAVSFADTPSQGKIALYPEEARRLLKKDRAGSYRLLKDNIAGEYISTRKKKVPIYLIEGKISGKVFARWLVKNHPTIAKKYKLNVADIKSRVERF